VTGVPLHPPLLRESRRSAKNFDWTEGARERERGEGGESGEERRGGGRGETARKSEKRGEKGKKCRRALRTVIDMR